MRDLLKSLKLIREFETRITIHKNEFTERLKSHVKTGDPSPLFSGLEIFSTDKREYIGEVNYDGFKFRRRRRLFEISLNSAIAKGKFLQKSEHLLITTEVNGFHGIMLFWFVFIFLFYLTFIILVVSMENFPLLSLPLILLHGIFMLGIPYLVLRRGCNRMVYNLERELVYIATT